MIRTRENESVRLTCLEAKLLIVASGPDTGSWRLIDLPIVQGFAATTSWLLINYCAYQFVSGSFFIHR